jgi:hypothetical protein
MVFFCVFFFFLFVVVCFRSSLPMQLIIQLQPNDLPEATRFCALLFEVLPFTKILAPSLNAVLDGLSLETLDARLEEITSLLQNKYCTVAALIESIVDSCVTKQTRPLMIYGTLLVRYILLAFRLLYISPSNRV